MSARHPRMVVARPLGSLSGCASSSSGMGLYDHGGVGGEGRHVVVRRRRGGGGAFAPFACPVARLLRASLLVVGGRRCRRIPATGDLIRAGLAWWWPDPVVMARGWPAIGPPTPRCYLAVVGWALVAAGRPRLSGSCRFLGWGCSVEEERLFGGVVVAWPTLVLAGLWCRGGAAVCAGPVGGCSSMAGPSAGRRGVAALLGVGTAMGLPPSCSPSVSS